MSDEVPKTADGAIRSWIAAGATAFAASAADMLLRNQFGSGLIAAGLSLALYLLAARWHALKPRLPKRFVTTLNGISTDARWWFGSLGVLLICLALSPFVEQWRLPFTAPKLTLATSVSRDTRVDHPLGISLHDALDHDFPGTYQVYSDLQVHTDTGQVIPLRITAFRDQHEGAEFLGAYIARSAFTEQFIRQLLQSHQHWLDSLQNGSVADKAFGQTGTESTAKTRFTGLVVVYYEDDLSLEQEAQLEEYADSLGLNLLLFNTEYLLTHTSPPPSQQKPSGN